MTGSSKAFGLAAGANSQTVMTMMILNESSPLLFSILSVSIHRRIASAESESEQIVLLDRMYEYFNE